MSNQTVTVSPGGSTLLNSNLAAGATIYNQDAKNAVWVSSHPDVSPGYGIPVQPLGTASWSGGTLYAITDTGVSSPVTLSLSSDVTATDNPVAVGAAVAAQLLSKGVPNVFLGGNPLISFLPLSGTSVQFDATNYGSVSLQLSSDKAQRWSIDHISQGYVIHTEDYVTIPTNVLGYIDVPVRAPIMKIRWTDGTGFNTLVNSYGSNRVNESAFKNRQPYIGNLNGVAFTIGNRVNLPGIFVSQGGQFFLRLQASGTLQGFLGFNYLDGAGAPIQFDMVDTKTGVVGSIGQETEKLIQLPPGIFTLYFNPQVSTTATVNCNLVPA